MESVLRCEFWRGLKLKMCEWMLSRIDAVTHPHCCWQAQGNKLRRIQALRIGLMSLAAA